MDRVSNKAKRYRKIVEAVLTDIHNYISSGPYQNRDRKLFDRHSDSYAIIEEFWENGQHHHYILIHLEIINDKVWIQADNTDLVVARELENAGIPKSDIVLGFHPPHIRPLTEYAVA